MTKCAILLEEIGVTNSCRDYIRPGDECQSDPQGVRRDNTRIGPVLDVLVTTNLAVTEVRSTLMHWRGQRRAKSSSLTSGKNQHILIEQKNWEHIPGVDRVRSHCLPISRRMTFLLRHFPKLRDRVGEVHREELTKHFEGLATLNKCDSCPMRLFADCFFDHAVRF